MFGKHFAPWFCLDRLLPYKASMQQVLFGDVNKESILKSFKECLSQKQKELVVKVLQKDTVEFPFDDLCDILDDFQITRLPNRENIGDILLEIGTMEFVTKPFLCLNSLRQGRLMD